MSASPYRAADPAALPPKSQPPMAFWYNRSALQLDVGGVVKNLTKTQASIMDSLMEVPGKLVTADNLIYQLYVGQDREEPEDALNVLRSQICYIRRKTGIKIDSVWGRGYRLSLPGADLEPGELYQGRDDIGRWHVMKIIREPVAVVMSEDGKDVHHLPMSSVKFWELELVERGRPADNVGAPSAGLPSQTDPDHTGIRAAV